MLVSRLAILMVLSGFLPAQSALRVLFLGDRGHHEPAARAQQVLAPMRAAGIDLHYTDRLADLVPEQLAACDAVLVYANHPRLPPAQERALLDFVASGKGLVAVHCASYCFLNSEAWLALVGGRFQSHGFGMVTVETLAPEHEALRGVPAFSSEDETYVHERHAADKVVLQRRDQEPWTWVREHGQGRVFYTAWGHDQRTWSQPGFQQLLAQGIRWAARKPGAPPPALTYAEAAVPEYQRGGRALGHAHTLPMQQPLPPAQEQPRLVVPPGLQVSLFASEPEIRKPIWITFDARGRAFVAETVDYPNDQQPPGQGRDRITCCEDTDRDGKADRFTLFADRLSIPTSCVPARGGLIVAQAPDLLFLADRDGDGKAEVREVLFSGFGTGDTHAGPSHLRYGFDGWIWGTCGYSGFSGEVGGKRLRFGSGIFRFRPDGSALEFLASTDNNTWGLSFAASGLAFASTANGNPSVHLAIENRHFERMRGLAAPVLPAIAETALFHPITAGVRQVDYHGRYTAGSGHTLYTARALPAAFWNDAFVCEPTGHLIGRFELEAKGATFVARDRWNLLASDDEWCAPIAAEVGPDGSIFVLDWYAYIVQHNPTPPGYETGKGGAYVTPLRDKTHGRIWRITHAGASAPAAAPDLERAEAGRLVQALADDNLLWRLHAQRLLVERGERGQQEALVALLAAADAATGTPALHALWTLHGLGALRPEVVTRALAHPAWPVRRAAAQLLPRDAAARAALLAAGCLHAPEPQVRLAALLALAQMPADAAVGASLAGLLAAPDVQQDRWLLAAGTLAAGQHAAGFLAELLRTGTAVAAASAPSRQNLIPDPSFEAANAEWTGVRYSGTARHSRADSGSDGVRSLRIDSESGADASWSARVRVQPGTRYRLGGKIKTADLRALRGGSGALLNVHELQGGGTTVRTEPVTGTRDWTEVMVEFESGERTELTINCLFGGWGWAAGTAWYDEITLLPVAAPALRGPLGVVTARVVRHFAATASAEAVQRPLLALRTAAPPLRAALLQGLVSGWPQGRPCAFAPEARAALAEVVTALDPAAQLLCVRFADKTGDRSWLPAALLPALAAAQRQSLADPALPVAARAQAAADLLALTPDPESIAAVLAPIGLATDPALAEALLDELAAVAAPEVAAAVLAAWPRYSPRATARAITLLLRRPAWTAALLTALETNRVPRAALSAAHWLALGEHPDRGLAARARALQAAGGQERQQRLAPYLAAAERNGDARRGEAHFLANCLVCHELGGRGGKLGPALTGIGKRAKADLLLDVLDPNRSIEATYRLWQAETKGGEVLAGRLLGESATTVTLLDLGGNRHELERTELASLAISPLSVMPEGFERLGVEGLADLLAYLAAQR